MVKVCKKEFPKGSYKNQQSDGYYMDGYLKENLDVCGEKIVDDMDFIFLVSGNGTVRNGKSAIAQQMAKFFQHKVKEYHDIDNDFTVDNIVFKGRNLIKKGLRIPRYSALVLDEGDDLTEGYWEDIAKKMRKFLRKCGQKNLFLVLILPDFFELPKSFALTRTNALVNVKFKGKFERGYFDFFNKKKKKMLYIKGKRYQNYQAVKPNFKGRFPNLYTVDEKEYRKKKIKDMYFDENDIKKIDEVDARTKKIVVKDLYETIQKNLPDFKHLSYEKKQELLDITRTTLNRYQKEIEEEKKQMEEMAEISINKMDSK